MSFWVVEPGLCSLIVDGGRPRTRSLGVPVGGPADRSAWLLGNALLSNPDDAAALEITLVGPVLQARKRVGVCVVGAPFVLSSGKQRLVANQSFTLEPGEELHIGGTPHGAHAYVSVVGGLQTPTILGSRSSLHPIRRGVELECGESRAPRRLVKTRFDWPLVPALGEQLASQDRVLRILPGPEADWFSGLGAPFIVRPESNRMGMRFSGPALAVPPREMVSQPMAPGTIQVARDGQLILLGVDGQSIGGYPRIANVISADLDLVGQLRPGDRVRFMLVQLADAERLRRDQRLLLERLVFALAGSGDRLLNDGFFRDFRYIGSLSILGLCRSGFPP